MAAAPQRLDGLEALEALEALAASGSLAQAVGDGRVADLLSLAAEARDEASSPASMHRLARHCLTLPEDVLSDFDDGTLPVTLGWDFGIAVAEAVGFGLAAFASSFAPTSSFCSGAVADLRAGESLAALEELAEDLDHLAPQILAGVSQLTVQEDRNEAEALLLEALRSICAWALVALGRCLGFQRLSAAVLFDFAARDAAWAATLATGALLAEFPEARRPAAPPDLHALRTAVATAATGLAAAVLVMAPDDADEGGEADAADGGGDVPIGRRNAAVARHRAALAAATAAAGAALPLELTLQAASEGAGGALAPRVAAFLAALLQTELGARDLDALASGAGDGEATNALLAAARGAARCLSDRLRPHAGLLWDVLAEVPAAQHDALPQGFEQDCANLAFYVPPSEVALERLLAACLELDARCGRATPPGRLAALAVLAANAGLDVSDSPLARALTALTEGDRSVVESKWDRWRGACKYPKLAPWAALLDSDENHEKAVAGEEASQAECVQPPSLAESSNDGLLRAALEEASAGAPAELRCQLDGQLLTDPVRTPLGHVFERAALARALQRTDGLCPITGTSLSIHDCVRAPEIRAQVARWVLHRRRGAPMPQQRLHRLPP
eukprot:TRINITY_DN14900_c0_g1_i2.p1 TRINITY_DN14900_c0_g1~~TRINITY_DN14900_c0_g1_i2.p1  ORF type:complete len:620 (-),score=189.09 TRINITY_DN14900_c0_g1_i2:78-1937(-)